MVTTDEIIQKDIEIVNKDFYNKLYKKRNLLIQLIYPFISHDQQSKSKHNYQKIKSILKESSDVNSFNILDYGFGHGSLLLKIPKKDGLFGCDISFEAVSNFPKVAKLLGKNVKTFTPEQLNQQKIKFNLISLSHVLEHIKDDKLLLRKLYDMLEAGGYILINVPVNEVWDDPKHVNRYTSDSLQNLLKSIGFTVRSVELKNRLSAFLHTNERIKKASIVKILLFRVFRFYLALMPLRFLEFIDSIIKDKYELQHLIIVAQKND